ncbi:hypothetical protein PA598K_05249 [Paenibacillus sp. 598K]|uniref:hypothetical protein n=1 Tax=Paenibacillus sp. 598K TaxID=1117987 RepID=UPI000FF98AF2|nr:hypothetical protein [Paenibacillus sp. 598K]GBF76762.1 hypothetical protein PA598K_05249 [Paenibacillus sp. 598K]
MEQISTVSEFMHWFGLPVAMSLIGGLIGHFVKNGIIELPKVVIEYTEDPETMSSNWALRVLQRTGRFLLFLLGYRNERNASAKVFFDLGILGDLLIAIGTGILAKTALAMANTDSPYAVISSSLLAGYAGLSYLKAKQDKEIASTVIESLEAEEEGAGRTSRKAEQSRLTG